jgi:hypothetical protein
MPKTMRLVALLALGSTVTGCALTRVLHAPDSDALELLDQQRRQEQLRLDEQQANEAHEHAVRTHAEMHPPAPVSPPPLP